LVLVFGALIVERATRMTPYVRDQVVASLNARFDSAVDLGALQVSLFPRPAVAGERITLRYKERDDIPPLLEVGSFSSTAGLLGLWRRPLHLRTVELDRLDIRIPAGGLNPGNSRKDDQPVSLHAPPPVPVVRPSRRAEPIRIDRLIARNAAIEIAPRDPTKLPRRFDIHDLELLDLGDGAGSGFRAALTNPKPHGRIDTEGTFGPWHADDPRLTPIRGDFLFGRADLNTIKGIGGTLSAAGTFDGVLERIEVSGHTETPDFTIDIARHPMPLKTRFEAVVDGTNGNTWLERVEATLRNTVIIARGAVVRAQEIKGRHVALDVTIEKGRLEDLLAVAVKTAKAPMTGEVSLRTRVLIPAGDQDVVDRLQLAGDFALAQARFTNLNVQRRISALSRRSQGDAAGPDEGESAVANLRGRFVMRNGAIDFSHLAFSIDGATVQLTGRYDLRRQTIDFGGDVLLDASLAEMTTGVKSVAARIAQPLFRRPGGGSKLPIRISGTRDNPSFGLDIKRTFLPG
jgi:hypothetical protein